ncbi:TetR/AcrR family transcriptional regulator [Streptomyces fuscigenes]|uniref:TetR/AcrR family transcriptional regulator n=1 Tax=Streptomyces fuscigenes TaxID=1528880 RepID=UPI001F37A4BA|nr:TetR family transcriptional regulator [Streptomyces fuscigenes]MCF3964386.1 TetR family transcriptional regulator [Streptomyces fuscigenes]
MAPTDSPLTPERILEATEDVLRRYGPAKATVVDVARALGVSHGSVYRHFRTKAALREAVAGRWLAPESGELEAIADGEEPAGERLRLWLTTLFAAKRRRAGDDPELFATFLELARDASTAVTCHVERLVAQLERVVVSGVRGGEFAAPDPAAAARALWDATARFHDPVHAGEWQKPETEREFHEVLDLLLRGLRA